MNDSKMYKLGTLSDLGISYKWYGSGLKGQRSRSWLGLTLMSAHSDINKVKVISELLSIRHSYVNLDCFSSEDIDFMIEFMCTD